MDKDKYYVSKRGSINNITEKRERNPLFYWLVLNFYSYVCIIMNTYILDNGLLSLISRMEG